MSGKHAFLAPSNAGVWVKCHGAAAIQAAYSDTEDSPASKMGTAAHWGAKELFYGRQIAVGQLAENGTALDAEMIQHVMEYVELVQMDMENDRPQTMFCEQAVAIPAIHELNWGMPDFATWRPGLLRLYDFKYGHMKVEVFENWQLLDYTSGLFNLLGIDGHTDQSTEVEFIIVQPRSFSSDGPVRRWRTNGAALRGYFNILRAAAEEAAKPGAMLTTGKQCDWCSAAHVCPALHADSNRARDMSERQVPFQLNAVQAGFELREVQRAIEILQARERGMVAQVEGFLDKGTVVPFYRFGYGRGRRVWKQTKSAVIAFGQMMGVNLAKPPDVITPTQAKELAIDPALIDSISEHRSGEKRVEPIDSLSVRKAFQ